MPKIRAVGMNHSYVVATVLSSPLLMAVIHSIGWALPYMDKPERRYAAKTSGPL